MFDFSFAELALIIIVAVVFIGPKELPAVVRMVARALRAMRGLAREVRGQFDELAKESGFSDIENEVTMIKGDDGKMYEAYEVPRKNDDSLLR